MLRSQHLGGFELAQGSFGLAAIEVKHRGKNESDTQRERVGDPLGQHQRIGGACERLLRISEQPFRHTANISGAGTGIMPAIDETMRRMLLGIVEPAPGIGVLAGLCRIPGPTPRRPGAMMRLEPQSIISLRFGHPQQSL